jgi:hypothetical protein
MVETVIRKTTYQVSMEELRALIVASSAEVVLSVQLVDSAKGKVLLVETGVGEKAEKKFGGYGAT